MMLRVDLSNGTRFCDRSIKQNIIEHFLYVYFRKKYLLTAFQVVRMVSEYYLILLPNICGIW
jgi:hypothetical protein